MNPATGTIPPLRSDQRGVVFIEFLMAFVPLWTFSLCVFQLALIARANLMVKHAADAAARSAIVVLPDDPNEYGGEPQMSVARNRITSNAFGGALRDLASALGNPGVSTVSRALSGGVLANLGRSRLNTIRLAAHVPLMPLAPVDVGLDRTPSLRKSLSTERSLLSSLYYQPFAVAVTFPNVQGERVTEPEITVRVTYAYQCTVPLARRILCGSFDSLEGDADWKRAFLPIAQEIVGGRFRHLQHEATLMIHRAPYEYRQRGS